MKKLKFKCEPGKKFEYQSVSSALLGIAVEKSTGMPLAKYLEEKIWIPLGMEYGASWSLDDNKHRIAKAYGGLNTTAMDLAKIGRLYLRHGNWEGKQILSEDWVNKSTVPNEQSNGYQYQWRFITSTSKDSYPDSISALAAWKSPDNINSKCFFRIYPDASPPNSWRIWYIHPYFYAYGFDGQVLGVCPEKNLIMIRLGEGEDFRLFMYILSTKL
ncbi:MAG: serine hydrolase [Bacteroidetes bacterium]|nr:serine hydrolase [Bacteroidota bacterium]